METLHEGTAAHRGEGASALGGISPDSGGQDSLKATRRDWIGLLVICLPGVLVSVDRTGLGLAIPLISAELQPSSSQLLWVVDIYAFFLAGLLITMGTLGDRIGHRRLLLLGAAGFGAASVIAACSTSTAMLIAARALLGIGGATLAPSSLSLIRHMFLDQQQRAFAIAIWVTSYTVGGAVGPLISGLVLQQFGWSAVFWIAVPVMALLLALGPALLPEHKSDAADSVDLMSAMQSLAAVLLTMYGFKEIAAHGFEWAAAICVALGTMICVAFVRRQRVLAKPFIDLRLLRSAVFSTALLAFTLSCFAAAGTSFFVSQYLQLVLGLSPLLAGLWSLPSVLCFVVGSMMILAVTRRFSSAAAMSGGLLVAAAGLALVGLMEPTSYIAILISGLCIFSLGLAPVMNQAIGVMVGEVPRERAGEASGISETGSELGGALGIAILGSVGVALFRASAGTVIEAVPDAKLAASDTVGHVIAVIQRLPEELRDPLLEIVRVAFDDSLDLVVALCSGIFVAMAIAVHVAARVRPRHVLQRQDNSLDEPCR